MNDIFGSDSSTLNLQMIELGKGWPDLFMGMFLNIVKKNMEYLEKLSNNTKFCLQKW